MGVEDKDEEDLMYEFSPSFWRMIEESRRSKVNIPLEQLKAELEAEDGAPGDETREHHRRNAMPPPEDRRAR